MHGWVRTGKRAPRPWPEWAELVPGVIWIYDFTHFRSSPGWCAIAVIDVVLLIVRGRGLSG